MLDKLNEHGIPILTEKDARVRYDVARLVLLEASVAAINYPSDENTLRLTAAKREFSKASMYVNE